MNKELPKIIKDICDVMYKTPHGIELKGAIAKIILKDYPNANVKNFLIKEIKGDNLRDWG